MHEGDEPNAVGDFGDSEPLAGEHGGDVDLLLFFLCMQPRRCRRRAALLLTVSRRRHVIARQPKSKARGQFSGPRPIPRLISQCGRPFREHS